MNTIPILFAFDNNLAWPAVVTLTSLLENAKDSTYYDIFIMHSDSFDFSEHLINRIPESYKNCRLSFIPVSGAFVGGYETRGITETCYYRLLAPELIPQYDKIIYSDVDVIIRDDLSELYSIDLGANLAAGVDNCSFLDPGTQDYINNTLGLNWKDGYCNSGELVMNLKQMREESVVEKFKALGKRRYYYQDQDILNIVANKRIVFLPPKYNLTISIYESIVTDRVSMLTNYSEAELDESLERGTIHYNGAKPWNGWCYNMDLWWHYYRKSLCYSEADNYSRYRNHVMLFENWSLKKRIKHVFRYFLK